MGARLRPRLANKIADRIKTGLALAGIAGIAGGVGTIAIGGVALLFALAFAIWSTFVAGVLWLVWNQIAPSLAFVAPAYQHLDYMTVWGGVFVLGLIGRLVFGRSKS